jgi:hypothetical protein
MGHGAGLGPLREGEHGKDLWHVGAGRKSWVGGAQEVAEPARPWKARIGCRLNTREKKKRVFFY